MKTKHKGAAAELQASAWLLARGYEVFRNVSQHGEADLIAWHVETNVTFPVDVKTASPIRTKTKVHIPMPQLRPEQLARGVRMIVVFPDGQILLTDGRRTTAPLMAS